MELCDKEIHSVAYRLTFGEVLDFLTLDNRIRLLKNNHG